MATKRQPVRRREPLLHRGWLNAVLAAAAALGWALYLRERRWRRHQQPQERQAPGSPAKEAVELDSDACQAQLSTPPAASAELEVGDAAAASHPQVDISSTAVQGAPAAEELQQGSSLEKEEAQLRGLVLELEALAAQLNQDVLLSARSARSARATAAASPASLQPEAQSSASPAMSAFRHRLSPLLLRPVSASSNLSSSMSTPLAAGSPERMPSAATTPGQQGLPWSPKPTVARLAGLQLRPGSSSSTSEAASPASLAATPASLGRMLRQGGRLAVDQLTLGLVSFQEQQQLLAAARQAVAAAPPAGSLGFPRSDSSMQQAPEHKGPAPEQPSSASVQRKRLAQRPHTPSGAGADFRIPAYKGSSSTPRSHGPSPSGSTRVSQRLGSKSAISAAGTPRAGNVPKATREWTQ